MTTAGLEPATFWCREAIEAKRATIALSSHTKRSKREHNIRRAGIGTELSHCLVGLFGADNASFDPRCL